MRAKETRSAAILKDYVDGLPFILSLDIAPKFQKRCIPAVIRHNGRISPATGKWLVSVAERDSLSVLLDFTENSIRILDLDRVELARLTPQNDGPAREWRVATSGKLLFTPRCFALPGVELLTDDYCREIAQVDGDIPCTLAAKQIGYHLQECLGVLDAIWPESIGDVEAFVRAVLPRESANNNYNSGSTGDLPFVVQLMFNRESNPLLLTESILHEMSHIKLDVAMCFSPVLKNGPEEVYRHPWRTDMRPMSGVFFGAHAFLAVMLMYQRAMAANFDRDLAEREFRVRQRELGDAMDVLERHALFTEAGKRIYEDMRAAYKEALS
jgi:hypothetical protein